MSEMVSAMYSAVLRGEQQAGGGTPRQFWNYGLWDSSTPDPRTASEQLVEYLLSKLPPRQSRVLDIAFGKGESTLRLCGLLGAENVVGINIGADQLEAARKLGVRCELHAMDAAHMDFAPNSFDVILCIEAAFHFRTRASFLNRAYSMLRHDGRLIMSDILFHSSHGLPSQVFPIENQIHSIDDYRSILVDAGFDDDRVRIERTTERQIVPYFAFLARTMQMLPFPSATCTFGAALSAQDVWRLGFMLPRLLNLTACVIVTAAK